MQLRAAFSLLGKHYTAFDPGLNEQPRSKNTTSWLDSLFRNVYTAKLAIRSDSCHLLLVTTCAALFDLFERKFVDSSVAPPTAIK
jgi:hypothetical protein